MVCYMVCAVIFVSVSTNEVHTGGKFGCNSASILSLDISKVYKTQIKKQFVQRDKSQK